MNKLAKKRIAAFDKARRIHAKNGDPAEWLRVEAMTRLQEFDYDDCLFKNHLSVTTAFCCEHCRQLEGRIFNVDEAKRSQALPQPGCTNEVNAKGYAFCLCSWDINMEAYRESRNSARPSHSKAV